MGVFTFRRLTLPLRQLALRLRAYGPSMDGDAPQEVASASRDEVEAIVRKALATRRALFGPSAALAALLAAAWWWCSAASGSARSRWRRWWR